MFPVQQRSFLLPIALLLLLLFTPTSTLVTRPPSALRLPPSPLTNATTSPLSAVYPYCFTPASHPGFGPTNPTDCRAALRLLITTPHFTRTLRFSKNHRSGVVLPKGWQHGDCVIYVSCSNPRDADYFSFQDVSREAVKIIKACVDEGGEGEKLGGIQEVGSVGTFYVSVGKPAVPRGAGGQGVQGGWANGRVEVEGVGEVEVE